MMGMYNREVSKRKAWRKRKLARIMYRYEGQANSWEYYDNLHQYSKNKIHCSCPCCSSKTRNKGRRGRKGNYQRALNYKPADLRKLLAMDAEELEFTGVRTNRPNRCKYESE
jgi:hypothetical protein